MNVTAEQAKRVAFALAKFNEAVQELANALEDTGYELDSAPEYLQDMDDFSYDIMTMVEDELESLDENQEEE